MKEKQLRCCAHQGDEVAMQKKTVAHQGDEVQVAGAALVQVLVDLPEALRLELAHHRLHERKPAKSAAVTAR